MLLAFLLVWDHLKLIWQAHQKTGFLGTAHDGTSIPDGRTLGFIVVDPCMDIYEDALVDFSLRPESASDIVATDSDVGGKDEAAAEKMIHPLEMQ